MSQSTGEFLAHLERSRLLGAEQIVQLRAEASVASSDGHALAARLVAKGRLTAYQAEHLLAGHAEGFVISKYKILEPIGEGGMGKVFRAEDMDLQREVALKVLSPQAIRDQRILTRFRREARAAARLNHENVVQVYDVGEYRHTQYIAMELVHGDVLSSLMKDKRLEWPQIIQIARGITSALAAAHAQGVLHRDIKPSNVIVGAHDQVKVVDFGLARLYLTSRIEQQSDDSLTTRTGTIIGTIPYLSPEQAAGNPLTAESDMFSLGSLLYELSTGQTPFRSSSTLGTLDAIIHEEPLHPSRLNPDIPERFEDLIIQLLAKDHQLRLSAEEVQTCLTEIMSSGDDFERVVSTEHVVFRQSICVGRDEELAHLRSAALSARQGRGSLLCVVGEAGLGKTTLVERFFDQLRSTKEPCILVRGSCSERLAGSDGYLPLLEALGDLLAGDRRRRAAELMRLTAPSWYAQVLTTQTNALTDYQLADVRSASQERMKREIVSFLHGLGRTVPVVIFLDDLHWVDISTADLITYLAGKCASMRLLLVCCYRPTEMALSKNPFVDAKLELHTHGVCEELALDILGLEAIQDYLDLQFPQHRFSEELTEVIHARTEGNALFLVDLVRDLRESGVLMREEKTWVLASTMKEVEQHIPDSVRSMIRKKVEQLDDADRRLLITASVQGAEFHAAVIAETLNIDECDVEDRLEFLTDTHGLVRRVREEELPDSRLTLRYAFVHVLYHNAFYGTLTPARRARASAHVAAALEEFYESDRAELALELALLFETARDFANAADYFLQASENAANLSANHEAISLARRAIENAQRLTGEKRNRGILAAAMRIARLCQVSVRFDDAVEAYELAEQTAVEAGDVPAQIEAICGKASTLFLNKEMARTRQFGIEALELARDNHLKVGQAQAESVLASERLCAGDLTQAQQLYDRAIPLLKEKGRAINAMDASVFNMLVHAWQLEYDKFEEEKTWWIAQARQFGISAIPVHFFGAMALGNQGRLSEALELASNGRRLAELNDDHYHICRLPNVVGWLYREMGDYDTAVELDAESQRLSLDLGFEEAEGNARVNLAHDFITLGELDRGYEELRAAEGIFERDVWFRWRYNIRLQAELARYWTAREDPVKAEKFAKASIDLARQSKARKHIAWGRKLLADIMLKQDCVDLAREQLVESLRILDRYRCPTIDWRVSTTLAAVARLTKDGKLEKQCRQRLQRIEALAISLTDERSRNQFLRSKSVEEAKTG